MGQYGHFTHVWVSLHETQVFRGLTVVNGTPRDLGRHNQPSTGENGGIVSTVAFRPRPTTQ